ncbi:MAG TPA: type VI secretion system tip protein VgrG [Polyangiaceae bacterium]|nr:type VI secretion system tip protein VgrG [Polyangiaceae bacterium]
MMAERDLFDLTCRALPDGSKVAGFRSREALSTLYELRVGILVNGGEMLDLAEIRGLAASFSVHPSEDVGTRVHGMVAEAGLKHMWGEQALYEIVIVPKVWLLGLTRHSRVFVDQSVPQVVEAILADGGMQGDDYELRLDATYPGHEHLCQYKESRWSFISRLMEREGLYYFFEQGDKREKLVITDHRSFHQSLRSAPVRYVPLSGEQAGMTGEALQTFATALTTVPRRLKLRDYDYLHPGLDVSAETVGSASSSADQFYLGDHDFRTADDGAPMVQALAQAWRAKEMRYQGRGTARGLRAGYLFDLQEHPLHALNGEKLVVELVQSGVQAADASMVREALGIAHDEPYRIDVVAIDAATQFRPMCVTPVPRISSVERGFVDGPADSDYAQIDEHGRYKVKLHFDIDDSQVYEGKASTWLRMIQPHGGSTEGFHFPLRKQTEVLVLFLGGNPDRPVIAGAVPNAIQPSPVVADNHTQNVIQTGGSNRIEIEDRDGEQYVDISTPPADTFLHLGEPHDSHGAYIVEHTGGNQQVIIGSDREMTIGGNHTIDVAGSQIEHVGGDVAETYDSHQITSVGAMHKLTVGGNELHHVVGSRSDSVDAGVDERYGAYKTTSVDGPHQHSVSGPEKRYVGGDQTHTIGGSLTQTIVGDVTISCASMVIDAPGGFKTITTGLWADISASAKVTVTAAATMSIAAGANVGIKASADFGLAAGAKIQANQSAELTHTAGVKAAFGSAIDLRASPITLEEATTWVRTGAMTHIGSSQALFSCAAVVFV